MSFPAAPVAAAAAAAAAAAPVPSIASVERTFDKIREWADKGVLKRTPELMDMIDYYKVIRERLIMKAQDQTFTEEQRDALRTFVENATIQKCIENYLTDQMRDLESVLGAYPVQ